jgi:hypothetical protein
MKLFTIGFTKKSAETRDGSGKLNTGEGGGSRLIWPKMA